MKKIVVRALVAAAAPLLAMACAHAQESTSNLYAEIGYTHLNARDNDSTGTYKVSPSAVSGVFGYQFTPNIAVEGLVGLGAGKGKVKLNSVDTADEAKLKSAVGVFFKPSVAVSDSLDLFARVGWVRSRLDGTFGSVSRSQSDTDIAYGIGANFNLSKAAYIQAGWTNYYKKEGFKVDGATVAYGVRF